MLFTSPIFLFGFLPVLLAVYFLLPARGRNLLLLGASLFFYAWGETTFVFLMLVSIVWNYLMGRLIERAEKPRWLLGVGVAVNLLALMVFKYLGFVLENLGIEHTLEPIHLPLGISFFTFQAISYLADVYRKETTAQRSLVNLGLYISFFPQLIAGPIIRYHDIAQQLVARVHTPPLFVSGIERFTFGLAKKLLIANPLGEAADSIYALGLDQTSPGLAWLAIICFSLQIYFDFSAYSDMAIGLGRMFGFKFQENFNYPYMATSVRDFWRRWHISLSTWFRDYLYIPLGGSRLGNGRTYFNLLLVFFLCGLWHGASWSFVLWGMIHGGFLILERLGLGRVLERLPGFVGQAYMLLVVMVGWVFFRVEDAGLAIEYLGRMFFLNSEPVYHHSYHFFVSHQFYLSMGAALILCAPVAQRLTTRYPQNFIVRPAGLELARSALIVLMLFLSLVSVSASTYNPFLYFRF